MKNLSFFEQMKCFLRNECIKNIDQETKDKEEVIPQDRFKQETATKLNYQLIDIDNVFAN